MAGSLPAAIDLGLHAPLTDKMFVIGGAAVYCEALNSPLCGLIYYTKVETVLDCDAFFPKGTPDFWMIYLLALLWTVLYGIHYTVQIKECRYRLLMRNTLGSVDESVYELKEEGAVQQENATKYRYCVYQRR